MSRVHQLTPHKTDHPIAASWFSNAPWVGTGYGTQTMQAVRRFRDDGHAVAVTAIFGLQGMATTWEDIPIYPSGYEFYSNDVGVAHFRHWAKQNPDALPHLFVLFDAWALDGADWDDVPLSIWTMVDHAPVPRNVLDRLRKPNVTPIAVTRFGQQEIRRFGVDAAYIPMAIDTDLYVPTPSWNGESGRSIMGFDDDVFVVSIINANKGKSPTRKAWGENLLAYSIFAKRHDDVRLYLHTERYGNHAGIALEPLLASVGLEPHQYRFVNQYAYNTAIPNAAMAALYTASDVLLASTLGEGFGLTVLEAQACGTRVIVNNFSAQPELVEDGWLTSGQPLWDAAHEAWYSTPDVHSIVDALEDSYQQGRSRSAEARAHAEKYDADLVWETYWRPYLATLPSRDVPVSAATANLTIPATWTLNDDNPTPDLTVYVPAFKRPTELAALLDSLAPQIDERVEVIVSDDDPAGSGYGPTCAVLADSTARVRYERRRTNVGGDVNLLRGYQQGTAPWVWMIGDDDAALPGAVDSILGFIADAPGDVDRLILLTDSAPRDAAGAVGTMPEIAAADPGLPIAATLITANVVRRDALDVNLGFERIETMYGHSWAQMPCRRIAVLSAPCFQVGTDHVNGYINAKLTTNDVYDIWADLLVGYGIEQTPESFSWNFVRAAQQAALAP